MELMTVARRSTITLSLKTGMYHIPSLNNDHQCFFDILEDRHKNFKQIKVKEEDDPKYIYRIMHFKRTPNYVLISLNRINREAIEEYTTSDSNEIEQLAIENHLEGFVWAYMDTSNNIIIDKNTSVSPVRFIKVISKMIDEKITFEDCPYKALSGKPNFEINYDRLDVGKFEYFYHAIEKLTSVTAKARVLSNPIWERTPARKELERTLLGIGAKKMRFEDKVGGMNKDNEIIQGCVDLSVEGHFDLLMSGIDSSDEIRTYSSTPENDDIYKYPNVEKDIEKFGNIATKLMNKVVQRRKSRSDYKITQGSDGGSDKDDDHQDSP